MTVPFQLEPDYTSVSPLPFMGGKSRAADMIVRQIPEDVTELVCPFAGGASVELCAAAKRGMVVYASDAFRPTAEFWQVLLDSPAALAEEAETMLKWGVREFERVRERDYWEGIFDPQRRAAVTYFVHCASFGALGFSGAGNHRGFGERWNRKKCRQLAAFRNPRLHVDCMDWEAKMDRHPGKFAYLDPPYMTPSRWCYGWKGDMHKGFNHRRLRDYLRGRDNWILSYGNVPPIHDLYAEFERVETGWQYSASPAGARSTADNDTRELLIFSRNLSPVALA